MRHKKRIKCQFKEGGEEEEGRKKRIFLQKLRAKCHHEMWSKTPPEKERKNEKVEKFEWSVKKC